MKDRPPVTIDMTPDGGFRPAPAHIPAWQLRLGVGAAVIAVAAAAVVAAAVFLWLATILIPVAIVAGLVAYAMFRIQTARIGRARMAANQQPARKR